MTAHSIAGSSVRISVDGQELTIREGITLAVAVTEMHTSDKIGLRRSVGGEWRGPFCGMGSCFECRVTVDGVAHQRSCQIMVRDGMEVRRES